jgi:hypothetical protein
MHLSVGTTQHLIDAKSWTEDDLRPRLNNTSRRACKSSNGFIRAGLRNFETALDQKVWLATLDKTDRFRMSRCRKTDCKNKATINLLEVLFINGRSRGLDGQIVYEDTNLLFKT